MDDILILWDIDGTLNVHGKGKHWNGEWILNTVTRDESPSLFEHFPAKFQTIDIRVNQALVDNFSSLDASHIEHQWLTAWEQEACTLFSPKVGFQAGESWRAVMPGENATESAVWWKTEAVRRLLIANPEINVIWVDDLIDSTEIMEEDNQQLSQDFPGRLAMVGVMAHQGVTPDVFNFIRKLAGEKWQPGMFLFE